MRGGREMSKKVNIIGAGIAGLSAGCYLQMNGYDTEIFELHNTPGGLCTSWKRKGFTIDGCIHWLVGSGPRDNFYKLWNELIDMRNIEFVDHEEFMRVEAADGKLIRVFSDVDKLEEEMLEKAPEDKGVILEFTNAVRRFSKLDMPIDKAPETMNLVDGFRNMVRFMPYSRALKKYSSISSGEYARKCGNPLLRKAFEFIFFPKMITLCIILTLVWMHKKSAGYPIGGSLEFSRLLERKYLELGGKINYRSRVRKIITEDDSAKGIVLENGETHTSDIVISAADGHCTIFEMLEGKYIDKKIEDYYENYEVFPSYVQVSLGISRTFENEPHHVVIPAGKPLVIDESAAYQDILFRIFNYDPTVAPEGKTLITALLPTANYQYWEDLRRNDTEKYISEKERIANQVIEILERRFEHVRSNVEVTDVSTPSTVIRYTNNWKGSLEGWILTPKMGLSGMKKVLPGLKNFYMAGQWVQPGGGVPSALLSGRNVTQIICKKDRKRFVTT
jgi:phytoene dehydrogenase-like protein